MYIAHHHLSVDREDGELSVDREDGGLSTLS